MRAVEKSRCPGQLIPVETTRFLDDSLRSKSQRLIELALTDNEDIFMIDTTPGTAQKPKITLCSDISKASGEDPAGSAWSVRRIVLMELRLPWAYNVLQSKRAPEGLEALLLELYDSLDEPWGMIGLAPDPAYSVEGMTRIIDLQQGDGIAATYHRDSYLVPSDEIVAYLRLLSYEPDNPKLQATRQADDQASRDFFICTHGAIDACCATMGYPLYKLLRTMSDQAETPTRVWRCTHFGGHRFAATALEAPQGRYWGHLTAGKLSLLMHQTGQVRDLRRHYRGWAALPEPLWQVAEAEVFAQAGWAWNDATITAITGEANPDEGGLLTMTFTHPGIGNASLEIDINPTGTVRTLDQSNSDEYRDAPQYRVTILNQEPAGCLDRLASIGG